MYSCVRTGGADWLLRVCAALLGVCIHEIGGQLHSKVYAMLQYVNAHSCGGNNMEYVHAEH
jgi:hypothetical protein